MYVDLPVWRFDLAYWKFVIKISTHDGIYGDTLNLFEPIYFFLSLNYIYFKLLLNPKV